MPRDDALPLYTRIHVAPWHMRDAPRPLPGWTWGIRACRLVRRKRHKAYRVDTKVPASHVLDVLIRVPDGTHELNVFFVGDPGAGEWPATWERVHLVTHQHEADPSRGLWWIAAPCLDLEPVGYLF